MKFLCPNCKAKYRIGAEKLVGRQAAKIRCRKCDYRIQIARKASGEGYDVTATATSILPSPPGMLNLGAAIRSQGASESDHEDEEDDDDDAPTAPPADARLASSGLGSSAALGTLDRRPVPAPLPPPGPRGGTLGRPVPRPFGGPPRPQGGATAQALESSATTADSPAARPAPLSPAPIEEAAPAVETAIAESGADLPKEDWFVGVNGVPLGPIPLADLCELAVAGHVDRRSLVWREGSHEWKPLGKLPELLRVVERVAPQSEAPDKLPSAVVPSGLPRMAVPKAPPVPAITPPAANKTTNGASVRPAPFGIPRPGAEPLSKASISSYTPIEEEDDDEEAPTTVKPRISTAPEPPPAPVAATNQTLRTMNTTQIRAVPVMPPPPGVGGPPRPSQPPPGAPPQGSPSSMQPFANAPFPVLAARAPLVEPSSVSSIGATPDPLVDEGSNGLLVGHRKSRALIWLMVAGAFILGVGITLTWAFSYMPQSDPEPAPASGKASASAADKPRPAEPAPPPPAAPSKPDQADEGVEIIDGPLPTAPTRPSGAAKPTGQVTADPPAASLGLLAGLNRLGEPAVSGPSTGPASRNTSAGGLDSTAIQQTVGRYKPSVQRGCWQPALSARAPGAPSSARVSVSLTVDGSGRVTSASTGGDPRGYPGLARCIESRVRGWRFPRSSGTSSVAVPFVFAGQ